MLVHKITVLNVFFCRVIATVENKVRKRAKELGGKECGTGLNIEF